MSDYRSRLPDDQTRAEFDAAIRKGGELLFLAYLDLAERRAREEAQAAA